MDIYAYVPALALGWYMVLLLSMMMTKTSKLKTAFLLTLCPYIVWTLGSVGMRFGMGPSVDFWFHLSLYGVFMIPSATMFFMERYMDGKNRKITLFFLTLSMVLFVTNVATGGCFIDAPKAVRIDGRYQFVYENVTSLVVIPYISYFLLTVFFICIIVLGVRRRRLEPREGVLIITGKVLLLLGNLVVLLELFKGFPIDMAAGVLDAITIFGVLVLNEKIKINRKVARWNYSLFAVLIAYSVTFLMVMPYANSLQDFVGDKSDRLFLFILSAEILVTFTAVYAVCRKVIGQLFFKDAELQSNILNEFREKSHQTLETARIEEMITNTIVEWMEADWCRLCMYQEKTDSFSSSKPLPSGKVLEIPNNTPLIRGLKGENRCIELETLHTRYAGNNAQARLFAMLKNERAALLQPIYDGKQVYALMVISKGSHKYRASEKRTIELLSEICTNALKNSELYTKVYWESRTDALTKVGNRSFFFERLYELKNRKASEPVSLVVIKIDDFRICNQLYGMENADHFLKLVAKIMKLSVPEENAIFRYGTAEFILLLRGYGEEDAKRVAEEIRLAVMKVSDAPERKFMFTISAGVCTVGKGKLVESQLVDNCMLALYMAQKAGKNCTMVYHDSAEQIAESLENGLFKEYEAVFRALTAAIDAKDHYTAAHSQNVSYYALELARGVGLSSDMAEIVKEAGLLHDIGKIGIPEAILMKPDKLTAEEFTIMKSHVEQAAAILHHLPGIEYILPAVLGHHERYDGTGYPSGIVGENIPLLARILCVADSFDAMISRRPYKQQYPLEYAINQLIEGAGTQFDPDLAPKFAELVKEGKIQVRRGNEPYHEEIDFERRASI